MTCWQKQQTSPICQSREQGDGIRLAPITTKVENTPWQIGLTETDESPLKETLLFGNSLFDLKKTQSFFLNASIDHILSTKRFEEALL